MTLRVRPKKFLGQHFLTDMQVAANIVDALSFSAGEDVLEIGPGKGVLTGLLLQRKPALHLIEIDRESVAYLKANYPEGAFNLMEGDCLTMDWGQLSKPANKVIGNFPYHISTPLLFKILDHKNMVQEVVCMLQKEVALRIASPAGNRQYGIPSVLIQTWYDVEVLFHVAPEAFYPPPKVMSTVVRLRRNHRQHLPFDASFFTSVVKQAFQNRRKKLRNTLKPLNLPIVLTSAPLFDKRPEQLSIEQFFELTELILKHRESSHPV